MCVPIYSYRSWWLFWSFVLLLSRARDYPHVGFMWPILAIKSNWWDKEPDVGWKRRLMWQLEIVRMRRGKSLGSSHSFTHSLTHHIPVSVILPLSDGRDPHTPLRATHTGMWHWCASRRQSRSKSGTRVIFTDRRARLPIHAPPLQMRDMTVYWWSHVANKTAQQK